MKNRKKSTRGGSGKKKPAPPKPVISESLPVTAESINSLREELDAVRAELNDRAEQNRQLEQDLAELRRKHKQLQQEAKTLRKQVAELEANQTENNNEGGDELAEALVQAREELAAEKEKTQSLQERISDLESSNDALVEEASSLASRVENQGDDTGEAAKLRDELAAARSALEEITTLRNDLEAEKRELVDKVLDLQSTLAEERNPVLNSSRDLPSSKATFRIYVFPGENGHQGNIEHLPSGVRQAFATLNDETILEFVRAHLPQAASEEDAVVDSMAAQIASREADEQTEAANELEDALALPPEVEEQTASPVAARFEAATADAPTAVEVKPASVRRSRRSVFRSFSMIQDFRNLPEGGALAVDTPFDLLASIHMPITPTSENVQADTTAFACQATVTLPGDRALIDRVHVAEELIPGVADYQPTLRFAGLPQGNYLLTINLLAPFGPLKETTKLTLQVR